jgi:sugar-specific transcriptional regulator TrmB
MSQEEGIRSLERLGFTRVEAEVYVYLIHNSPATGYRIAKAIDRTKGATYKVLESLANRGAAEADGGQARLWRAVPIDEFLGQLERRFNEGKRQAREFLKKLEPAPLDNRIYHLQTVEQVYERARRMLETCEKVAFLIAYPDPLKYIGEEARAAIERGVRMTLLAYENTELPGALVIRTCGDHPDPRRFPVRWLALSIDGRELLIGAAAKDGDKVFEAFWSASPFFSWVLSSYIMMSILAENVGQLAEEGGTLEDIQQSYKDYFEYNVPYSAPGFADLLKRFGLDQEQ